MHADELFDKDKVLQGLVDEDESVQSWTVDKLIGLGPVLRPLLPSLTPLLQNPRPTVRQQAIRIIGEMGPDEKERVVPLITPLLRDESIAVRVAAAAALIRADGPIDASVRVLADALSFDDGRKRSFIESYPARRAAGVLAGLGPEAEPAVPKLIEALKDERFRLRLAAANALGSIGPKARSAVEPLGRALRETKVYSIPLVHVSFSLGESAREALEDIGPASIPMLLKALDDSDPYVRAHAALALGSISANDMQCVPALTALLSDENTSVRIPAIQALADFESRAAAAGPALAKLLFDGSEQDVYPSGGGIGVHLSTRREAASALLRIDPKPDDVLPALISSIQNSKTVNDATLRVLRHFGPRAKRVGDVLEPLLDHPKTGAAASCAMSYVDPTRPKLLASLKKHLKDSDGYLNVEAANGVGQLRSSAPDLVDELLVLPDDAYVADEMVGATVALRIDPDNRKAATILINSLRFVRTRFQSINVKRATASLNGLAVKPHIQLALVKELTYHCDPSDHGIDEYRARQREANVRLRAAAILAEARLAAPKTIAALAFLATHESPNVRGTAADNLVKYAAAASSAVPALVDLLDDDSGYVVGGDVYGKGGRFFRTGDQAVLALAAIGESAVPKLIEALNSEDFMIRARAAKSLAHMGWRAAAAEDDLLTRIDDNSHLVRASAATALGNLLNSGAANSEQIRASLQAAKTDHRRLVREAATAALAKHRQGKQ